MAAFLTPAGAVIPKAGRKRLKTPQIHLEMDKKKKLNLIFRRQKRLLSRYFTLKHQLKGANFLIPCDIRTLQKGKRILNVMLEIRMLEVDKFKVAAQPIPKYSLGGTAAGISYIPSSEPESIVIANRIITELNRQKNNQFFKK
jgi:hypothetical protein